MPLFELQKDGKTFEVDAPDMQTAINAMGDERSLGGFFSNLASNAGEVAGSLYNAATQPVETVKNLGKLGAGMVQQFVPGQQEYETTHADPFYKQVGRDFGFKRGEQGIEWDAAQLGKNLYERPVDLALDASMMVAPLESIPGKVGTAARIANPLNIAGKAVTTVAKTPAKIAKYYTGEVSGMGPQAIAEAYRTGKVGGSAGQTFRENMRGVADPTEAVDMARGAVGQLRTQRSSQYQAGKAQWAANQAPLNFQAVENAYTNVAGVQKFRGKQLDPATAAVHKEIRTALDEWANDAGAWTAEGFDALKQRIQSIGQAQPPHSPGSLVAGRVATAVKGEIVKQAPEYAKAMSAYEKASNVITELTKSLSLGAKTSYDTALRKLQSILRNNAFTNYSARAKLAKLIEGLAPDLMPALAGQSANAILPRGLPGKLLTGGGASAAGLAAAVLANPLALIPFFASLAAGSPRLVGEVAHGAGRITGGVQKAVGAVPKGVRVASKTGTIAATRQQSLAHAENVVSTKVMDHIKKAPRTRGLLNDWLKARNAGQGVEEATRALADAIAAEVKKPELAGRIAQELSQSRGP